jgi:hypothetical protein
MKECPLCDSENISKAIYAGWPLLFCEDCNCIFGFFAWIMDILPFNGYFLLYEGPYLKGLIAWWKGMDG